MDRLRSQLVQERQLRAVTEACLMEDRVAWQQVSVTVSDTLQHCVVLRDRLSSTRYIHGSYRSGITGKSQGIQWRSRTFGRPGRWSNLPPFRLRFLKLESLFKAKSHVMSTVTLVS